MSKGYSHVGFECMGHHGEPRKNISLITDEKIGLKGIILGMTKKDLVGFKVLLMEMVVVYFIKNKDSGGLGKAEITIEEVSC